MMKCEKCGREVFIARMPNRERTEVPMDPQVVTIFKADQRHPTEQRMVTGRIVSGYLPHEPRCSGSPVETTTVEPPSILEYRPS